MDELDLVRSFDRPKPLALKPRARATPIHHSLTDWDFMTVNWNLDTGIYVSSPSSLKVIDSTSWVALCKAEGAEFIPEGRIVSQIRLKAPASWDAGFVFRNIKPAGGADLANCYFTRFGAAGKIRIYRRVNNGSTILYDATITGGWTPTAETWYQYRATWWVSAEVLMIRVERWTGSEWTPMADDVPDPTNMFAEGPTTRPGIYSTGGASTYPRWFDDTEIWEKAA